jgi:hypothetical protein
MSQKPVAIYWRPLPRFLRFFKAMAANGKTIIPTSRKLTTGSGKLTGSLIVVGWIVVGWIDAVRWVAMMGCLGVVW